MEFLRAFIAIDLDPQVQQTLKLIQYELKKTGADIRFVKPQNIHLTLKFLGDISLQQIDPISQILKKASLSLRPFTLSFKSIGAFPAIDRPDVIWIAAHSPQEIVMDLAKKIEERLMTIGIPREKREFKSHVTLGRLRSNANIFSLIKMLKTFQSNEVMAQNVKRITLFKSILTSHGPHYEALKVITLNP